MVETEVDFAAAAMLRVVTLGLDRLGLRRPTPPVKTASARVPLNQKRALLRAIALEHGSATLLQLGQGVHCAPMEAGLQALLLASGPADLVQRWQRLERFVHTRHRVAVIDAGTQHLLLHHYAQRGEPPWPEEDALVWGLLVGLLQRLGYSTLKARFDGEKRWRFGSAGVAARDLPAKTGTWLLRWQQREAPPRTQTMPASDALLDQLRELLAADPSRAWALPQIAQTLHRAPRSLQRELGAADTSFSQLLQAARVAAASKALVSSKQHLAEIGYVCGYADQAHFTREFKRHAGLTPLKYREQFGV